MLLHADAGLRSTNVIKLQRGPCRLQPLVSQRSPGEDASRHDSVGTAALSTFAKACRSAGTAVQETGARDVRRARPRFSPIEVGTS